MTKVHNGPGGPERAREAVDVHTRILRVTLAEPECRAYWENVDLAVPPAQRAAVAFEQRWFGAKSMARVQTLLAALADRFDAFPESLAVLRAWPELRAPARVLVCHLHLQLTDPVYRAFTGDFLVKRRASGHPTIGRDQVERWVHETWGDRWAAATRLKFASNLLTAAGEAGLVAGRRDPRALATPRISDEGLGYVLYLLRDAVPEASLVDNPYVASLGLTREALVDRLRAGDALRVRSLG
ncbi:MAG: DUF1819 domain-containing protein, partial [Byssovorax sp.]